MEKRVRGMHTVRGQAWDTNRPLPDARKWVPWGQLTLGLDGRQTWKHYTSPSVHLTLIILLEILLPGSPPTSLCPGVPFFSPSCPQ